MPWQQTSPRRRRVLPFGDRPRRSGCEDPRVTAGTDVDPAYAFTPATLPYGVAPSPRFDGPRVMTRLGGRAIDLAALADGGALPAGPWRAATLNPFLESGPEQWRAVRAALQAVLTDETLETAVDAAAYRIDEVTMLLPVAVGDYVDFYASEHHASNVGRLLRPGQPPLLPNWHHLPVGYHGRSGTVVVSGTPVCRPRGQLGPDLFGPTQRLDVEVEVGFVVGSASALGEPVALDDFADHVFGLVLVNDWSARDIQAWEYQPLGPFLGKSFATSISPWVVPLDALAGSRRPAGSCSAELLPYLRERESEPWGLDLSLSLTINGEVLTRPPFASMFWSPAQMLAHLTVNGASVRAGDLFASGTVSGPGADEVGSLLELHRGETFLDDGDEVVISGWARGADGTAISIGDVRGVVLPND
ncbi:MAG: fumarylacetoacetate hydrolase family protein [Frankiales bacterium]|nr:fumarylacetoacetate hydrolase family protein [Frankiales bacterium]